MSPSKHYLYVSIISIIVDTTIRVITGCGYHLWLLYGIPMYLQINILCDLRQKDLHSTIHCGIVLKVLKVETSFQAVRSYVVMVVLMY